MKSQLPRITVVIPVKNGAGYLSSAIDSVITQGYPDLELIVVDGKSTDGSRDIALARKDVCLLDQGGAGLGDAWNTGIRAATGELVAFLDSDDVWEPDTLVDRVTQMPANSEMQIARVRFFLEPGHEIPRGFKPGLLNGDRLAPIPGTLLARRRLFDHVGLFDTGLKIAADVDWFARAKDADTSTDVFDSLVLQKRIHGRNLAADAQVNNKELLALLRHSIARQKRNG